jgi:hypothetical protein
MKTSYELDKEKILEIIGKKASFLPKKIVEELISKIIAKRLSLEEAESH